MNLKKAPDFILPDKDGNMHTLKEYKGKWIVLYFYPRDNTAGCTKEAMEFTKMRKKFEKLGAVIIGISKDSQKSHKNFAEKHNLKILLLSDPDHTVIEKYRAWGKKKMYGKEYNGVIRSTFLINPDGYIVQEWKKVKVTDHVDKVLKSLKEKI